MAFLQNHRRNYLETSRWSDPLPMRKNKFTLRKKAKLMICVPSQAINCLKNWVKKRMRGSSWCLWKSNKKTVSLMWRLLEKVQWKSSKSSRKSTRRKSPKEKKKKTAKIRRDMLRETRKPIRAQERRNTNPSSKTHKTNYEAVQIRRKSCPKSADNPTRLYQATSNPG